MRNLQEKFLKIILSKLFPKWSKADTKIARFMKNLNPRKIYTDTEMKEYCKENGIRIYDIVKGDNNTYGDIIKKVNNTYQLYPELIKAFEENF